MTPASPDLVKEVVQAAIDWLEGKPQKFNMGSLNNCIGGFMIHWVETRHDITFNAIGAYPEKKDLSFWLGLNEDRANQLFFQWEDARDHQEAIDKLRAMFAL